MRIINSVEYLTFWGLCFLLVLLAGFGVGLQDIIAIALSLEMNLAAICLYLLCSLILFPILVIFKVISNLKSGLTLGDVLAIDMLPILWMPYKGLDLRELFNLKTAELDKNEKHHDLGVYAWRIVYMALWWFIFLFGLYTVYHQSDNAIRSAIEQKSFNEIIIIIGIVIAVYFVLHLLAWIIQKIVSKKWKNEVRKTSIYSGTKKQRYYERHPERIPSGCRACGGPYPECKASCTIYDD